MKDETVKDWHARVEKSIEKIMSSLDDNLSLERISEEAASSSYHFHRIFKELTGETLKACIRRLRLERAVYEIRNTDKQITYIAFDAGYETLESFTKAFHKAFDISPSFVRNMGFWNGKLPSKSGLHYYNEKNREQWFYGGGMEDMQTKIVNLKPMNFISMRSVGDYWKLPKLWNSFVKKCNKYDLFQKGSTTMSIFHHHHLDIPESEKVCDAAITVSRNFPVPDDEELFYQEISGGLYAVTVHFGSSEEIGFTGDKWKEEWLPKSGWKIDTSRPSLEWYQNDLFTVPSELLITFICEPVCK